MGGHKGEKCVIPCLHVGKKDFDANSQMGTLIGKNVNIHDVRKVVNTGTIHALNKVTIKANTILNKTKLCKKYSIRTPLAGGEIVGFDIEIEVPKNYVTEKSFRKQGIYNIGGTVFGTHKVSLYSKKGDVVNTALIGHAYGQMGSWLFWKSLWP